MTWTIAQGDARERLREMPSRCVRSCVTSPPYFGLRDYGADGQIGAESSPAEYVDALVAVFGEVRRVLADDGTLWLNVGDSYATNDGSTRTAGDKGMDRPALRDRGAVVGARPGGEVKQKDLVGIPWMVAFALRADGWYLRSDVIWHKPNPMPESVQDRPTSAHEHVFLLTKSPRYFYDADAVRQPVVTVREPGATNSDYAERADGTAHQSGVGFGLPDKGANARNVWSITSKPFKGAHFACMPPDLAERCILAGSEEGDTVLDPFTGAGTTALVALRRDRSFVGIELNPAYVEMARERIVADAPMFNGPAEVAA